MPKDSEICYETVSRVMPYVWRPEKERLKDFLAVTTAVPPELMRRNLRIPSPEEATPINRDYSTADRRPRDIPLHILLEYGAVAIVGICLLSLVSWALNVDAFIIVSPFAALLSVVMSPFIYLMGRAART